ncbi:PepSY domain-containing protein [Celeribacter neptunius]|nr:PepSY domain-containing protein [Celeribacter neptunius]
MIRSLPSCFASCLISAFCLATPAFADEDHDFAREAFARGDIISLARILPELEAQFDARLIDAEIEREHGAILYEITLISDSGRLIEVEVDAETGDILSEEDSDDDGRKKHRSERYTDDHEDDD